MSTSSDWKLEQRWHDQFDGSAEYGHRNALESSPWRSGGETTVHHTSFGGEIRFNKRLRDMLPIESATLRAMLGTI